MMIQVRRLFTLGKKVVNYQALLKGSCTLVMFCSFIWINESMMCSLRKNSLNKELV